MKAFEHDGRPLWVGMHATEGAVVFDPDCQGALTTDRARLWLDRERRMGTFLRSLLGGLILPDSQVDGDVADSVVRVYGEHLRELEAAAEFYAEMKRNARHTHCYKCGNGIDSVDFSLCSTCSWIKCSCGACGCGYLGGRTWSPRI
jgi:hypothetical protein